MKTVSPPIKSFTRSPITSDRSRAPSIFDRRRVETRTDGLLFPAISRPNRSPSSSVCHCSPERFTLDDLAVFAFRAFPWEIAAPKREVLVPSECRARAIKTERDKNVTNASSRSYKINVKCDTATLRSVQSRKDRAPNDSGELVRLESKREKSGYLIYNKLNVTRVSGPIKNSGAL